MLNDLQDGTQHASQYVRLLTWVRGNPRVFHLPKSPYPHTYPCSYTLVDIK